MGDGCINCLIKVAGRKALPTLPGGKYILVGWISTRDDECVLQTGYGWGPYVLFVDLAGKTSRKLPETYL